VVVVWLCAGGRARADAPVPVAAQTQILVEGLGLEASPEYQAVPRNLATAVSVTLVGSDGAPGSLPGAPADALVEAELRGPAFGSPVTLTARPGDPLAIPPLALAGLYSLSNIRLVAGGETLLEATPDATRIEVIDQVLVSQVTSRPLSASRDTRFRSTSR
jgi:hypothetical protein